MPRDVPPDPADADAGVVARFVALYGGPHAPLDALHWLADPRSAGPSGAPSPFVALAEARSALYRAGAGDDERAEHARLAAEVAADRGSAERALSSASARGAPTAAVRPDDAADPGPRWTRRRSQRLVLVLSGAILLALLGAVALRAVVPTGPTAVTMVALRFTGAQDLPAKEAAVQSLLAGSFSAENQLALRAVVDRPPALAQGADQRWTIDGVRGSGRLAVPALATAATGRTVTVLVLCTTASAYRWSLVARGGKVLADSSGRRCAGTAASATVAFDDERPALLRFTSGRSGRSLVAVVVTPGR